MDKFFSKAPEIIREAAKSTLGVISLVIIAISLLALTFFTTASENVRVGIFIFIFIGASLFIASLLHRAKLDQSGSLRITAQISTSESTSSEDELSRGSKSITTTCMHEGVAYFLLTEKGEFVGGIEALRRVSLDVLDSRWEGQIEVHHAFLEKRQHEVNDLLKQSTLTVEEAQTLEHLRGSAAAVAFNIEIVCLALKLTFTSVTRRKPTWGVPMTTEAALGFLTGVFTEMKLIPDDSNCTVRCQLYVPERIDDPVAADILLCEDEIKNVQISWENELGEYDASKWLSWKWPTLIPLWKFPDEFIAARLLPIIVTSLARSIATSHPATAAVAWEKLSQRFPLSSKRTVFVPYHWCLALNSERSLKDLAWLISPPQGRSQLLEVLGR